MIFPLATRVQAVTLRNCGYSWEDIERQTGIGKKQLQYILGQAKRRGYNPKVSPTLKNEYFHDGAPTPRPTKLSKEQIAVLITASRPIEGSPRKTNAELAKEFGCSERTIRRFKVLPGAEYKKPIYGSEAQNLTVASAETQVEGERDVDVSTASSTAYQTSFVDSSRG